jgi:predicted dehydrogenase
MTFRAGVIGVGRIGLNLESDPLRQKPATHAGMWLWHDRTDLVALCDPSPDLAERAARVAPGVACFADVDEMISSTEIDIVSIASHQDTHVDLALRAIEGGARSVVCEKPISDDVDDAKRLIDAAKSAGVHLIINHTRRFDPMLISLADRIAEGLVGDVYHVSGYYVYGMQSTGTHLIDLMRMLIAPVAGEIAWVSGHRNDSGHFHPDGDPCLDAVACFESGAKATVQSLNMKSYDILELQIFGSKGRIRVFDRAQKAEIFPVVEATTRSGFTDLSEDAAETLRSPEESYFGMLAKHTIDCLDGKDSPRSTGTDSLKALGVIAAIQESAIADGRKVLVD